MLVSALAGREHVLHAYEVAVQEKYRFFSFGDAMFINDNLQIIYIYRKDLNIKIKNDILNE